MDRPVLGEWVSGLRAVPCWAGLCTCFHPSRWRAHREEPVSPDFIAGRYWHIVRGPDDPERSPREERRGQETAWKRKLTGPLAAERWADLFMRVLGDGCYKDRLELTFNAMCVIAGDINSATAQDPQEEALWALVLRGMIEMAWPDPATYDNEAWRPYPMYFRVTEAGKGYLGSEWPEEGFNGAYRNGYRDLEGYWVCSGWKCGKRLPGQAGPDQVHHLACPHCSEVDDQEQQQISSEAKRWDGNQRRLF